MLYTNIFIYIMDETDSNINVDNANYNSAIDIDLHFSNRNLGIGKQPTAKLDVDGNIRANQLNLPGTILNNVDNIFKISHNDSSNIILSKNKSVIFTDKLGINNNEPKYTLDVEGDMKFNKHMYGKNGLILNEEEIYLLIKIMIIII